MSGYVVVERRDVSEVVARVQLTMATPEGVEAMRAAQFAARRLGVTCWGRDVDGRVLHVAPPDRAGEHRPTRAKRKLYCPWPGCPASTWDDGHCYHFDGGTVTREAWIEGHAAELHVLCSCGRFFTAEGWAKHRGQYRRADRASTHLGGDPIRIRLRSAVLGLSR